MASLHSLSDYNSTSNLGLRFPGMQSVEPVDYQLGSDSSGLALEHWRQQQIQQFPFLHRVEPPSAPAAQPVPGLYQFEEQAGGDGVFSSAGLPKVTSAALITQMASVKMEGNTHSQGANSLRGFVGMSSNEDYWGGAGAGVGGANSGSGSCAGWATELASFNSTSCGNIL
jgi:hypothetical protein